MPLTGYVGRAAPDLIPRSADRELPNAAFAEMRSAGGLLPGRRSYEFFSARWASATGAFADTFNATAKYVASATLSTLDWTNSTLLAGDPVDQVAALKADAERDLLVYASLPLVRALIEAHLVDELRLTIFPEVLGSGRRLFDDVPALTDLRLGSVGTVGESLVSIAYELA